jgi:pimeloyl-ACP methyl ester carboxylesterase
VGVDPANVGNRRIPRRYPVPGNPGLFEIVLDNTGSGYQERFLLQIPDVQPPTLVPLLVVFHKFGVSHWDVHVNTTFPGEAQARGWYLLTPLGASGVNFSSLESQINIRAAVDFVASSYNVDRLRVYGAGFSMGGGSVTSYAARHLDPSGVMFAAIANHTGGVSLPHTHFSEPDDNDADDNVPNQGANLEVPDILEFWYGGPPSLQAFNYLRCSMIDLDPFTLTVGTNTDMSRNLPPVPVLNWLAANDPLQYLYDQTQSFHDHIQTQNAANTLFVVPGSAHTWQTLNETQVCDWLAQFTLQMPTSGSTLADEDGVYFHFQVDQANAGNFARFTWSIDASLDILDVSGTAILKRLTVDSSAAGFSFHRPVTVSIASGDGTGEEIRFLDVSVPPSGITRDGQPATGAYDPRAQTLLIREIDATGPHQWVLLFP